MDRPAAPDPRQSRLEAARDWGGALRLAVDWLREAASLTPALDAQTLLARVTAAARATLLAYPEHRSRQFRRRSTRRWWPAAPLASQSPILLGSASSWGCPSWPMRAH